MGNGKQTTSAPGAKTRDPGKIGYAFDATQAGRQQRAGEPLRTPLTWGTAASMDAMCGGHCLTDDEIYGELDAIVGREKGSQAIFDKPVSSKKDREGWKELVGILQKETESSKLEKRKPALFEDLEANIRYLRYRLRTGKLDPDEALWDAAQLDSQRLMAIDVKPSWVRAVAAARLTVLVGRYHPVTPEGERLKEEVERFIDVHSSEWVDAFIKQYEGAIPAALAMASTPVVTVNDKPAVRMGELMLAHKEHEQRELFNIALTMAMPLLMISAAAKHTPILGTMLEFMMDPGGTLDSAWDTITHPRRTWRGIKKSKEEHGWNAFNPAYWAMVNFYEAGQSFERWGKTKDPKYALQGVDQFGQGVGSSIDTIGVATGATALRPGRIYDAAKRRVGQVRDAVNRVRRRPEVPKVPDVPDVPKVPDAPDAPKTPHVPDAPPKPVAKLSKGAAAARDKGWPMPGDPGFPDGHHWGMRGGKPVLVKNPKHSGPKYEWREATKSFEPKVSTRTVAPGKKGAWNRDLNGPLEPNTHYTMHDTGYTYATDGVGNVVHVKGKLKLKKADRHTSAQRKAGGSDRLPEDQGGHLIGSRFSGPGEKINLVPQNANLNLSAWKKMENQWADALGAGKKVSVEIKVSYPTGSTRPRQFVVRYHIDGAPNTRTFNNIAGQ